MKPTKSHLAFIFITVLLSYHSYQVSAKSQGIDNHQLTYHPPSEFYVRLWHLTQSGAKVLPETQCGSGHDGYGCVAYSGLGYYYPYNSNPALVSVENDYLLDVVPRELDPRLYHSVAEAAEAVAARSYAYYWNHKGWIVGNDSNYQVFIPYTFEQWLDFNIPDNLYNLCQSTNLNQAQLTVCNAVESRYYISYYGDEPAQAEFTSDVYNATVTDTGQEYSPYIHSVQDPISTSCDSNNFGPLMGMSQEGASRWARGHECSYSTAPVLPGNTAGSNWSIRWYYPEQILFHYYTSVNLRNVNNGNAIISPAYRWNPLKLVTSGRCPPNMYRGQRCTFTFTVQNTGTTTWQSSQPIYLGYHGWDSLTKMRSEQITLLPKNVPPGDTVVLSINITPPSSLLRGQSYVLRFEMGLETPPDNSWEGFSTLEPGRPWITHDIAVCIEGCRISMPIIINSSITSQ